MKPFFEWKKENTYIYISLPTNTVEYTINVGKKKEKKKKTGEYCEGRKLQSRNFTTSAFLSLPHFHLISLYLPHKVLYIHIIVLITKALRVKVFSIHT